MAGNELSNNFWAEFESNLGKFYENSKAYFGRGDIDDPHNYIDENRLIVDSEERLNENPPTFNVVTQTLRNSLSVPSLETIRNEDDIRDALNPLNMYVSSFLFDRIIIELIFAHRKLIQQDENQQGQGNEQLGGIPEEGGIGDGLLENQQNQLLEQDNNQQENPDIELFDRIVEEDYVIDNRASKLNKGKQTKTKASYTTSRDGTGEVNFKFNVRGNAKKLTAKLTSVVDVVDDVEVTKSINRKDCSTGLTLADADDDEDATKDDCRAEVIYHNKNKIWGTEYKNYIEVEGIYLDQYEWFTRRRNGSKPNSCTKVLTSLFRTMKTHLDNFYGKEVKTVYIRLQTSVRNARSAFICYTRVMKGFEYDITPESFNEFKQVYVTGNLQKWKNAAGERVDETGIDVDLFYEKEEEVDTDDEY